MVPLDHALSTVLAECRPLPSQPVALRDVTGLVLAADVVATENVPPFDNSALDGYAVRASDVTEAPVELPVAGEVAAGAPANVAVAPGSVVRIMTGAPMPPGADAVVMVEHTESLADGSRVLISRAAREGAGVRRAGEDVTSGTVVAAAGTVVSPALSGVLASVNARVIQAFPRARVAVLATGDELVDDGSPLRPGQIRESNSRMLVGLVAQAGAVPDDLGVVRDDEALLETALRQAAETNDAIVTSGGVSMGDYDVVKAVLARVADMRWMQIAIKPAKPFALGVLVASDGRRVPVFGLPGNPVSSLVSFELLARCGLRQMMGDPQPQHRRVGAVTDVALGRAPDGKDHWLRVHARVGDDGRLRVVPAHAQGSHQLAASAACNALAVLPDGSGAAAGDVVQVVLLGAWR